MSERELLDSMPQVTIKILSDVARFMFDLSPEKMPSFCAYTLEHDEPNLAEIVRFVASTDDDPGSVLVGACFALKVLEASADLKGQVLPQVSKETVETFKVEGVHIGLGIKKKPVGGDEYFGENPEFMKVLSKFYYASSGGESMALGTFIAYELKRRQLLAKMLESKLE